MSTSMSSPATAAAVGFDSLPVELLEDVLSYLPTKALLSIGRVSRRVYNSVEFIAHKRFRSVEVLEGHNLVFQCSSPGNRFIAPYHNCWYKGSYVTPTTSSSSPSTPTNHLGDLYAHFRPLPAVEERGRRSKRSPPQPQLPLPTAKISDLHTKPAGSGEPKALDGIPYVTTTLPFDASEYFTQLCASSSIFGKLSPPQESSSSTPAHRTAVQILEKESFFRIRRSWLRSVFRRSPRASDVFWLDDSQNVGIKMLVVESGFGHMEIEDDDEGPTVFMVRYEELVVRTGYLVDLLEKVGEEV
ncbi:hypothetical protein L873DRAFT_1816716 [Choiromyces venosus 120613-1]|uniref:F-box domain-containing protein n=1 Tax=Choiromyces venosus 120613-1 TaxID=1336337 RepID=A0A3N4J3T1_9PEZI|nr:hypothetical protein L873DRAFT_1816716 [Choiromyces venosus 120613-1]